MINLSNLISKQLLNLYSGSLEGTIKNVYFDKQYKKVVSLTLFDNDEEEYTFPTNKIYAVNDYVVARNSNGLNSTLNQITTQENNPIGLNVYSTKGENLGKLCDIVLNDNLTTKEFVSSNTTFLPTQIVNISKSIIVNQTTKKVLISNFRPRVKILPTSGNVKIMTIENLSSQQSTPQKFVGNVNFLIGRTTTQDIYSPDNKLLAQKGTTITQKLLGTLKTYGKLSEITIYSKK
jgi:sporulation protein YlmC with PRC-barrel domain